MQISLIGVWSDYCLTFTRLKLKYWWNFSILHPLLQKVQGAEPRDYPFSILGLGDIVIPGLFIRFMSKIDSVLKPEKFSYFGGATFAYAAGLSICFAVNKITHTGQPGEFDFHFQLK